MPKKKARRGFAIPTVLMVITIVITIGFAVSALGMQNLRASGTIFYNTRAKYVAEAGMSQALETFFDNPLWNGYNPGTSTLTFKDVKMPSSEDKYNVWVCNRFFTTNQQIPQKIQALGITNIPLKSCYILAEGRSGNQVKHLGIMLRLEEYVFLEGGIIANGNFEMTGNGKVDSYDSRNPGVNNTGKGEAGCQGDYFIFAGNAKVNGDVYIGPSTELVNGNGRMSGEMVALPLIYQFPDVEVPTGIASPTPAPNFNSTSTANPLPPGNYSDKDVNLAGNNTLYLKANPTSTTQNPTIYIFNKIKIAGNAKLDINTTGGGVIHIYVIDDLDVAGNGVANSSQKPTNVTFFSPTTKEMKIAGNGNAHFVLYAPNTDIKFVGNADFYGAVVGKNIKITGNGNFFYDLALKDAPSDPSKEVIVGSWQRF
jgi:hypothetical protein